MSNDTTIYREYIEVAANPKKTTQDILDKFGISRRHLYTVVHRVRRGNAPAIRRRLNEARLEILWEEKYRTRFQALPKNRKQETIDELRDIVRSMFRDNFPQKRIAHFLKKDRSTIIHHIRS